MYSNDRTQLRTFLADCWRKRIDRQPLQPLEVLVANVIEQHPEYQQLLLDNAALESDWHTAEGASNPFLHLSLHLSLAEQLQAGHPPPIGAIFEKLVRKSGDRHQAEHLLMECLEQCLWLAQRDQRPPDMEDYLACARKLL